MLGSFRIQGLAEKRKCADAHFLARASPPQRGEKRTPLLSLFFPWLIHHFFRHLKFAFLTSQVNAVTHAVGNTIKRVVIIIASVVAFKTPMSTGSIIGSSIAIAGTLMYSLAMNASKSAKKKD